MVISVVFLYRTLVIISVQTRSVTIYGVDVYDFLVLDCKQKGSWVRIDGVPHVFRPSLFNQTCTQTNYIFSDNFCKRCDSFHRLENIPFCYFYPKLN